MIIWQKEFKSVGPVWWMKFEHTLGRGWTVGWGGTSLYFGSDAVNLWAGKKQRFEWLRKPKVPVKPIHPKKELLNTPDSEPKSSSDKSYPETGSSPKNTEEVTELSLDDFSQVTMTETEGKL